jgi:hypothetical protein
MPQIVELCRRRDEVECSILRVEDIYNGYPSIFLVFLDFEELAVVSRVGSSSELLDRFDGYYCRFVFNI